MIIGGEALYRALLPVADRIYLTEVHEDADGDTVFPEIDAATDSARGLYLLAQQSLRADTAQRADALEGELREALLAQLGAGGIELAAIFAGAPSVEVTRHLWRNLDAAWREATPDGDATSRWRCSRFHSSSSSGAGHR
jgi:hypothetical protein